LAALEGKKKVMAGTLAAERKKGVVYPKAA
jgi:hypothetical protein